jgi:hypothetical protein
MITEDLSLKGNKWNNKNLIWLKIHLNFHMSKNITILKSKHQTKPKTGGIDLYKLFSSTAKRLKV